MKIKITEGKGYYCDKQMARKKKLLPCDKKCNNCFACIVIKHDGSKEHLDQEL